MTWAHKLVQRMLDSSWPPCFMQRYHIPLVWSALCGTLALACHYGGASENVHVSMHYLWFSLIFAPYVLRIYFSSHLQRDLLIDVLDLLDMFLASRFLSRHHVYGYACALLFIQMGLRPNTVKPVSKADAAKLVDSELTKMHQDTRILSSMFFDKRKPKM